MVRVSRLDVGRGQGSIFLCVDFQLFPQCHILHLQSIRLAPFEGAAGYSIRGDASQVLLLTSGTPRWIGITSHLALLSAGLDISTNMPEREEHGVRCTLQRSQAWPVLDADWSFLRTASL